jgi:hypothetical protein
MNSNRIIQTDQLVFIGIVDITVRLRLWERMGYGKRGEMLLLLAVLQIIAMIALFIYRSRCSTKPTCNCPLVNML